jgi:hypothetical protein
MGVFTCPAQSARSPPYRRLRDPKDDTHRRGRPNRIEDDLTMQKPLVDKLYPAAAASGSGALDLAGVSRTATAATIAASAANPASA